MTNIIRTICTRHELGDDAIANTVLDWCSPAPDIDVDDAISRVQSAIDKAIEEYDDRLVWFPESDRLCWQDSDDGRQPPEFDLEWWDQIVSNALSQI